MPLRIVAIFTSLLLVTARVAGASPAQPSVPVRDWLRSGIHDPNFALALVVLGVLGIYGECLRPGLIVPGVAGGVLLLFGLSAVRFLPIRWVGAWLIALAFGLFLLEVKYTARGVLGLAGTAAFVCGARWLVGNLPAQAQVEWSTALGLGLPFSGITLYLLTIAARARRNKRETAI